MEKHDIVQFKDGQLVIDVGYRVKFIRGIRFRKWAASILKNHTIQGYALNEKNR